MTYSYTASESWTYTDDEFRLSMSVLITKRVQWCGFWVGLVGISLFITGFKVVIP